MKDNQKGILKLLAAFAAGIFAGWLFRKRKDKFSSFGGQRVFWTLTNNTNTTKTVNLFNTSRINPTGGGGVTISGSMNVDEWTRMLQSKSQRIVAMEVRVNNSPNKPLQSQQPILVSCKSATGMEQHYRLMPMVSAYQVQPNMTTVETDIELGGGGCSITYTLLPQSSVGILMHLAG